MVRGSAYTFYLRDHAAEGIAATGDRGAAVHSRVNRHTGDFRSAVPYAVPLLREDDDQGVVRWTARECGERLSRLPKQS